MIGNLFSETWSIQTKSWLVGRSLYRNLMVVMMLMVLDYCTTGRISWSFWVAWGAGFTTLMQFERILTQKHFQRRVD